MARIFECDSRAVATVQATFYGCIENTGNTVFYLRASRGAGGVDSVGFTPLTLADFLIEYSSSWPTVSGPTIGGCNNNYRYTTKTLTFDVTAGQPVTIEINHDLNGNSVNNNWVGFNSFSFSCSNVP